MDLKVAENINAQFGQLFKNIEYLFEYSDSRADGYEIAALNSDTASVAI